MRVLLAAVGRLKSGPERELLERYRARAEAAGRGLGFAGPDLAEIAESRARRPEDRRAEEAGAIRARTGSAKLILFDERGRTIGSEDFAARLAGWRDAGEAQLAFVVGGPDGLAAEFRDQAALVLSFGALTLPHQLVQILVAEQFYRALTILAGHPYHRGG